MTPATRLFLLIALACAMPAHAQLYKWVGPDGKVNYTDTPPPPNAKQVEQRSVPAPVVTTGLPFELAEAVRNSPVTLYTTANCGACDEGRKLLQARGVPFNERTVTTNDDIARLRAAGGDSQLPFLVVGRHRQQGFEPGQWNTLLTTAGYPATSMLPRGYAASKPEPAAPPPAPAQTAAAETPARQDTAPRPTELPPPTGNAPPGFRF